MKIPALTVLKNNEKPERDPELVGWCGWQLWLFSNLLNRRRPP